MLKLNCIESLTAIGIGVELIFGTVMRLPRTSLTTSNFA